jgi:outer membrane protein OmpA-like peptidoglycan-associated protein
VGDSKTMTMQRRSIRPVRPSGVILALAKPALGAAWIVAGMLASGAASATGPHDAKPRPKLDCASIPPNAPLPAECRKGGPDADGDKIADASDGCPSAAEDIDGFEDADGCPDPDNDGDGALDEEDGCPLEAEDRDGYKDADGCPEPDNDGDGVLDTRDLCPLEAESFDGSGDGDGCPDLLMVSQRLEPTPEPPARPRAPERPPTMPAMPPKPPTPQAAAPARPGEPPRPATSPARPATPVAAGMAANAPAMIAAKSTLPPAAGKRCPDGTAATAAGECPEQVGAELTEISDTIQFAHGTDTLLEASYAVLDQVVDILDGNPNLRVMIVGHADGRGHDQFNLRLSMMRAVHVRAYLLQQSREPQQLARRLEAVGIGSRQPLGNNESAVGRSKNRRVQFLVTGDRREPARRPAAPAGAAPAAHLPAAHSPAAQR